MKYNIRGYHGGLGDQLMWSTLPEMLTRLGHDVYLYDGPDVMPIRNAGIKELVWANNPFIRGVSSGPWNCGDLPGVPYVNSEKCFIMNAEKMMGLAPTNWLPKVYYEPKVENLGSLKHCKYGGIIELSAIHHKYNPMELLASVAQLISDRNDVEWCQIVSPGQSNPLIYPYMPQLQIEDIFQLADTIANCRIFASCLSGQHSLAAAMQRINPHFEQYCFIPKGDFAGVMASKKFVYPNVEYLPT